MHDSRLTVKFANLLCMQLHQRRGSTSGNVAKNAENMGHKVQVTQERTKCVEKRAKSWRGHLYLGIVKCKKKTCKERINKQFMDSTSNSHLPPQTQGGGVGALALHRDLY